VRWQQLAEAFQQATPPIHSLKPSTRPPHLQHRLQVCRLLLFLLLIIQLIAAAALIIPPRPRRAEAPRALVLPGLACRLLALLLLFLLVAAAALLLFLLLAPLGSALFPLLPRCCKLPDGAVGAGGRPRPPSGRPHLDLTQREGSGRGANRGRATTGATAATAAHTSLKQRRPGNKRLICFTHTRCMPRLIG
jgi:hypothetical protein